MSSLPCSHLPALIASIFLMAAFSSGVAYRKPQTNVYSYKNWLSAIGNSPFSYKSLQAMLAKQKNLMSSISKHISNQQQQQTTAQNVDLSLRILGIYQRELKAVESSLVTVLQDLNQTLSSDYHSIEDIKQSCKMRQADMRRTAILVEEDYNIILELEKETVVNHQNNSIHTHFNILNQFFSEISHAADTLEKELMEDIFSEYRKLEGADFETVVKLNEESLHEHGLKRLHSHKGEDASGNKRLKSERRRRQRGGGFSMLIDSASNQYILSRPRDTTLLVEDHHFIHDIVLLLIVSFAFGIICSFFKIPSLFGFVFSGMMLGPTVLNLIGSVVQVESLGEIGVIFIIFMVGLEFSPQKLQKVWNVAVGGGNILMICSILLAIALGSIFQVQPQHSLFVAACLSFSSNPLATRIVDRSRTRYQLHHRSEGGLKSSEFPELDIVDSVNGILMMQDIQLGTLVALLSFFDDRPSSEDHAHHPESSVVWGLRLMQVIFGFPVLVLIFRFIAGKIVERLHRQFGYLFSQPHNVLMGAVFLCFIFLLIAEVLGASLELGCFLAGVILSSLGPTNIDQVKRLIDPIREFFAVFFFASLGFHVYPSFLKSEFVTLCSVMVTIVVLKLLLSVIVLGIFVGHCHRRTFIISVSLAQVSEFSFVLASRARRIGIISREVYLVILGITTLSLLFSPFLWQLLLHPSSLHHSLFSSLSSFYFRLHVKLFSSKPTTIPCGNV